MAQGNMGTYSISVISDFSQFNQGVLNAVQMLSQQTTAMTNMLTTMNLNASKSMAQMSASMGTGVKAATAGVTTAFQSMSTNISNSTNQASRAITASVGQTTASLNGLQSAMNNVNTAGVANSTGNLTQQHGNLQNALRASTQSTNMLSGAFSMLRSHLEYMATGALIAGLIGIPALMIKTAAETETLTQKMRQNLELADQYHNNTQKLDGDLKQLNDNAGKFAVGFGVGIPDVMESMQLLSRRFKDVESISYLTSVALTMNKLDFVNLGDATKNLEAVMLQFDLSAQGTKQFLNDFSVACHVANIKGSDLMDALQRSGSAFKGFNMGSREAIAAVSALSTETARTGSTIGNTMKSITANFSMDKAITALESYNIKLYDVSENGMKTMRDGANVFAELQNLYAKLDDEGKSMLALAIAGGKYQVNAMQAFLADANGNFSKIMNELKTKSSDEMTQELLKTGMETFTTKLGQTKAAFQVFAQTMGNQVLPYLKNFTVGLTGSIMWMKQHSDSIMNVAKVLGDLLLAYTAIKAVTITYAAATALVSVYTGLQAIATAGLTGTMALATAGTWAQNAANIAATASTVATTFATYGLSAGFTALWASMGPIGWAVLAITALGVAIYEIYTNWAPILQWMKDTWNTTVNFIADNIGTIMLLFPPLGAAILLVSVAWEPVVSFLKSLWTGFVSFMQAMGQIFVSIFDGMCTAFPLFVSAAKVGISNFTSIIGDLVRSILPAWGNDVLDFFVSLGNKIASITAQIGATIRKNLTITGINGDGGVGSAAYGPQNKEKSPFDLAQEQAKLAYEQMVGSNTIAGGGDVSEPTIGNQIPGKKGKNGKGGHEDTAYQIAKKEFEAANAKAEYETESAGKAYTSSDKLALYQAYMTEVTKIDDKHHQETLEYLKGEYELKKKINDEKIALEEATLNREIALAKISAEKKIAIEAEIARKKANNIPLTALESKVDISFQKVNNESDGSVAQMNARTAAINAEVELDKLITDIANERINRKRQLDQAEIDLDDAKNKILIDNRGINEVQYNMLLIANEEKRYQIKLKALQEESKNNADNQKEHEVTETKITTLEAQEIQKRIKMNEDLEKAKRKNITELRDATASSMSQAVQDWVKGTQTMLGAIKSVFSTIINTVLKQFTDEWAKTMTKKLFSKALSSDAGKGPDVKKISSEVTTQAGITAAAKAGSVARNALIQTETITQTTANATTMASTAATEGATTGIVVAGETTKVAATTAASASAVSASSAALTSMLAMLPILLLISALTGGGGGGSSSTSDGPAINLGRNPDSYYQTPTALRVPSFDVGTLSVPHDMLAQIHKGEVIVPAPFADQARSFISGENSGGDTFHISVPLNASAIDAKGMDSVLKKHGDTIGKVVQNEIRKFKYKK